MSEGVDGDGRLGVDESGCLAKLTCRGSKVSRETASQAVKGIDMAEEVIDRRSTEEYSQEGTHDGSKLENVLAD